MNETRPQLGAPGSAIGDIDRSWSSRRPWTPDTANHGPPRRPDRARRWARRTLLGALAAVLLAAAPWPLTSPDIAAGVRRSASTVEPLPGGVAQDPPLGEPGAPVEPAERDPPVPPVGAGIPAPGARYAWPLLPSPAVTARFQAPPHVYGPGHRGVDLAGTAGQPVLAARGGTVVFAGPVAGRSVVSVHHDDTLRTTYEPVQPTVAAGAVVSAGDVIGRLEPGHPGCAPTVCLHWGVRRGRLDYLDPLVLLRPPEVRLLPLPEQWPEGIATARAPPIRPAAPGQPTASSSSLPRSRPTSRVCS